MRASSAAAAIVASVLTVVLPGCREVAPKITGVEIAIDPGGRVFDRFEISLTVGGDPVLVPMSFPRDAGAPLSTRQSLVVYLDEARDGQTAACSVTPWLGDSSGITATMTVKVARNRIVQCAIGFGGVGSDAGASDVGDTGAGDAADAPSDAGMDMATDSGDGGGAAEGCATGPRRAFRDAQQFPNVAGCGNVVAFSEAAGAANGTCAPNWHWCEPREIGDLPDDSPDAEASFSCSWVAGGGWGCDAVSVFSAARCAGGSPRRTFVGGGIENTCLLSATLCDLSADKLVIQYGSWATASVLNSTAGVCAHHVTTGCASSSGGIRCGITCCRNSAP
jgi:hypothetical protein